MKGTARRRPRGNWRTWTARAKKTLESFKEIGRVVAAGLGFQQMVGLLRSSVQAFAEQEQAIAKLNGVMRAGQKFSEDYSAEVQELSAQLQKVTQFGDDSILGVSTTLIANGAGRRELAALTEAVLDLATGLGTDLSSAATLVGKALQGEFGAFSRYGIAIDETKDKGEQLRDVLDEVNQRFGGLARATADIGTGSLTQFKNNIGELKEILGEFVVTGLKPYVDYLSQAAEGAQFLMQNAGAGGAPRSQQEIEREMMTLVNSVSRAMNEGAISHGDGIHQIRRINIAFGGDDPVNQARMRNEVLKMLRPDLLKAAPASGPAVPEIDSEGRLKLEDQAAAVRELIQLQKQLNADFGTPYDKLSETFSKNLGLLDALEKRGADVTETRFQLESDFSVKVSELSAKENAEFAEKERKKVEEARKAMEEIADLRNWLSLGAVSGHDRERLAASLNLSSTLEQIEGLKISAEEREKMTAMAVQGYDLEMEAIQKVIEAQKEAAFWGSQMGQIIQGSTQIIGSSFSTAFIDIVSGTEEAGDALKKFFGTTLAGIGQMLTR